MTARRAILRKPIDRIGYGGYLKLALDFPEFLDYVESVCNEFRELYENAKGIIYTKKINSKVFVQLFVPIVSVQMQQDFTTMPTFLQWAAE